MIGVGIFLAPADMARSLGSPFWALVVWLGVGLAALCGALCYGELSARWPEAGGGYVYLREAWGPAVAFLYGWKSLLVMDPGLTAALGAGVAGYAAGLMPLSAAGQKAVAVVAILALASVNVMGVRIGGGVLQGLTALKLALLGVIVFWGFLGGHGSFSNFLPFFEARPGSDALVAGLAGGVVSAFFAFGGFWDVAKLAGEVKEPARNLPRALAGGVAIVSVVYVLTTAVFFYLVPLEQAVSGQALAASVGLALFGAAGGRVFAAVVVIAVLGSLAAVLMAAPRVVHAMARDGVVPRWLGEIHPHLGTPARATALQAALACLFVGLGSFDAIVAYFVFVTVAFLALSVAGLYRLGRPGAGAYRAPGYPWTPAVFLTLLVTLLALLAAGRPAQAALGTLVVALGIPVYALLVAPRRALSSQES